MTPTSVCRLVVVLSLLSMPSPSPTAAVPAGRAVKSPAASRSAKRTGRTKRPRKRAAGCTSCRSANSARRKARATRATKSPCQAAGYVNPAIRKQFDSALRDMRRAGIKPRVTSTWRSSERQDQLHRCSISSPCRRANPGLYKALPAGRSLHEAGFAVDISGVAAGPRGSKRLTRRGRRIVKIMRKHGFAWSYGLRDPAHFQADPKRHGYKNARQAIKLSQRRCAVRLAAATRPRSAARPKSTRAGKARSTAGRKSTSRSRVTRTKRDSGRLRVQARKRGKNG